MGDKSKIEWTDATWNPLTGCQRVSPGCENCYAERLSAGRLASSPKYTGVAEMGRVGPRWTGLVREHPEVLDHPLRWTKPRMIFVNSMSDTFLASPAFLAKIFAVMALAPDHTFQVLTKRSEEMAAALRAPDFWSSVYTEFLLRLDSDSLSIPDSEEFVEEGIRRGLPNVWIGVSIEDQERMYPRLHDLLETPAAVRFLSCEPLLGPLDFEDAPLSDESTMGPWSNLEVGVNWVIAGGESGPGARPMHPDWVRALRDDCAEAGVPFFFKQWGEWAPHNEVDFDLAEWEKLYESGRRTHVCSGTGGIGQMQTPQTWEMLKVGKGHAGRELDGRTWDELPT